MLCRYLSSNGQQKASDASTGSGESPEAEDSEEEDADEEEEEGEGRADTPMRRGELGQGYVIKPGGRPSESMPQRDEEDFQFHKFSLMKLEKSASTFYGT